jgi:hypothetical protein
MNKPVTIIPHAWEQIEERGTTELEVLETLENGKSAEARLPRLGKSLVFTDGYIWKGRTYPHKLVRIIYEDRPHEIAIITVYVYYGRWEV